MESNVKRFETELNYDEVRRSLAEALVVLQDTAEKQEATTIQFFASSTLSLTQSQIKPIYLPPVKIHASDLALGKLLELCQSSLDL